MTEARSSPILLSQHGVVGRPVGLDVVLALEGLSAHIALAGGYRADSIDINVYLNETGKQIELPAHTNFNC